jgi:hypothetical protein
MVYRLVSKNTYEQQLFECSSRKMGLDEAILGFAGSGRNRGRQQQQGPTAQTTSILHLLSMS